MASSLRNKNNQQHIIDTDRITNTPKTHYFHRIKEKYQYVKIIKISIMNSLFCNGALKWSVLWWTLYQRMCMRVWMRNELYQHKYKQICCFPPTMCPIHKTNEASCTCQSSGLWRVFGLGQSPQCQYSLDSDMNGVIIMLRIVWESIFVGDPVLLWLFSSVTSTFYFNERMLF